MQTGKKIQDILEEFGREVEKALLNDDFTIDSDDKHTVTIVVLGERISLWTANGSDQLRLYQFSMGKKEYSFPESCDFKHKKAIWEIIKHKLKTFDFGCEDHD